MKTRLLITVLLGTIAIVATALLNGCASAGVRGNKAVPSSDIQFDMRAGTGKLILPKNAKADSIKIQTTNALVQIDKLEVENNPDVVGASYNGFAESIKLQAEMIREINAQWKGLTELILRTAAASQGIPLATTNQPAK